MSAAEDWIEGGFEGVYSGEPRSHAALHGSDEARRFDFELESGRIRAPTASEAPGPEQLGDDVIRQRRVRHIVLPSLEGDGAARETTLFDVHVSDWQLKHPAEIRGRAYGTIVGTIRARTRPAEAPPPEPLPAIGSAEVCNPVEPTTPAESSLVARAAPLDDSDPDTMFERFVWAMLVGFLALSALAIGYACSPRNAGIWLTPIALALVVRRVSGGGLLSHAPWWLAAGLVGLQLAVVWGPLQLAWRSGCWPALDVRLIGIGLPVVLAAGLAARWPACWTAAIWTFVICSWCSDLSGSPCSVAPQAGIETQNAAALERTLPSAPRTAEDGHWPVMPSVALPQLGSPGGGGAGGLPPPALDPTTAPGGALRVEVPPRGPSTPTSPSPLSDPPSTDVALAPDTRAAGRVSGVDGGWVAPDHRRAERELVLISIEQANRTPQLFFGSEGARRVYVPTDPIFADGSSQLRANAGLVLARVSALLSLPSNPSVALDVHSDSAGAPESQISLSRRRADTVRGWLIDRGHIDPQRFEMRAVGGTHPLVPPDGDYAAQQPNRRIEIRLTLPSP